MNRVRSKQHRPYGTLQSFLENLTAEAVNRAALKGSTGENALHLSSVFVGLVNENSSDLEKYCGRVSAARIFESIKKHVIRKLAEHADAKVGFTEFVNAYELLLEYRLSQSAGCFEQVLSQNEKRKRGVFYTPDNLAREMTLRALSPLVMKDGMTPLHSQVKISILPNTALPLEKLFSLKIVDPAMGAGSFLFMALELLAGFIVEKLRVDNDERDWITLVMQLEGATNSSVGIEQLKSLRPAQLKLLILRTVATKCMYGLDVDDAAVELVKIGMARRCQISISTMEFGNIRHGNSLVGLWQNPHDADLSNAMEPISDRAALKYFQKLNVSELSDKQRRDLVCLQFFTNMFLANESGQDLDQIAEEMNFFHWNLEFPDVFSGENPGFDLVLTNPPWEIEKSNSREFFSRYDAAYMTLSKQAALSRQKELISADGAVSEEWTNYVAYHEGLSAFLQNSGQLSSDLQAPFCHQGGGDSNSYKLFLELGYFLLRTNGVMAQIVPSGIYSDLGTTQLRRLFVERCRWLFLHGYHNREGIFSIHRSFKFCTLGIVKGGQTDQIECRFLRVSPDESEETAVAYKTATLKKLSPDHLAFTEVSHESDLKLIEKLAHVCVPLGALQREKNTQLDVSDISISFRREFDMTNNSKLFIERTKAQEAGFGLDIFGHWLKGAWRSIEKFDTHSIGDFVPAADGQTAMAIDDIRRVLLPVYEGRMVGQYDWSKKAWLHGKGRRAEWSELAFGQKRILPQYLLDLSDYLSLQPERGAKVAYLAVGASTNTRSCISAMIGDWPCGNAVPVLSTGTDKSGRPNLEHLAALLACLNSFVFDYLLRLRLSANNLNWFILKECLIPDLMKVAQNKELYTAVCELSMHEALSAEGVDAKRISPARRLKLRAYVEAVIADAYSIEERDCELILRGCDIGENGPLAKNRTSIDKGFHRIDLHQPPDLRGPNLFYRGFHLLQKNGAKWLSDNLDNDDVLFSKDHFDQNYVGSTSMLDDATTPNSVAKLAHNGAGCSFDGFEALHGLDAQQLKNRIRNAGASRTIFERVP